MFREVYQAGYLSVLCSIGYFFFSVYCCVITLSKPLQIWDKNVCNGEIKPVIDNDICSTVIEMTASNIATNRIICPANFKTNLGIKMPFFVLLIKNLEKQFSFEVHILDDKNVRRRIRASNFQSTSRVKSFICSMPLMLEKGWNRVIINLQEITKEAFSTNFVECMRIQIHPNCRIRNVFFSDKMFAEDELPKEFKLLLPPCSTNNQDDKRND